MNHIILTRIKFQPDNHDLMDKYLKVCKDVLVPALRSQTCEDFTWLVMARPQDEGYLREHINFPFKVIESQDHFIDYVKRNHIQIQTRHDCDDWMRSDYIRKIQDIAVRNINSFDKFLIQAQPVKYMLKQKQAIKLSPYSDRRTSMHLTLVQRKVENNIHEYQHSEMWRAASKVFTLPEGYTRWVIHGDNITLRRK